MAAPRADRSEAIFRRCDRATLTTEQGDLLTGRGVIAQIRAENGEAGAKRSILGALPRPMYRFVGYLPGLCEAVGGVLRQGDRCYRVLDGREICLGGSVVCVRALLETIEEGEDAP